MKGQWEILGEEGLRCFGAVSASISHELRNSLAIVHENAGLLQDLCAIAADTEKPHKTDRLKDLSGRILNQLRRTDSIIRNFNAFAHTVDAPLQSIEMEEYLRLIVALFSRPASVRGVTLEAGASEGPVTVVTNPFLLTCLLWFCLTHALEGKDFEKNIVLLSEADKKEARIRLQRIGDLRGTAEAPFPAPRELSFAEALDARIDLSSERGDLVLALPRGRYE